MVEPESLERLERIGGTCFRPAPGGLGQSPKVHVDEAGRDIFAPVARLDRMSSNIRENLSPNHDERPAGGRVDTLILHYTGMQSAQAAIDRLCDPVARVSSHY